jgi:hypothetical protein
MQNTSTHLFDSVDCPSRYFHIDPKIPYDKAAISVKQIDAIQIGDHELG